MTVGKLQRYLDELPEVREVIAAFKSKVGEMLRHLKDARKFLAEKVL